MRPSSLVSASPGKDHFVPLRPDRLAAFLLVGILVVSCSPSQSPAPLPSPSATAAVTVSATPTPTVPTSETLIAAALTSGAITYEQSLLYRALALFDSPGLPQEYRSAVIDLHAAEDLFVEIDAKQATLSAGLLTQLAPYRVRPADPIDRKSVV